MALIKCSNCGEAVSTSAQKCPHCGYVFNSDYSVIDIVSNDDELPQCLDRWNWGAFWLSWLWAWKFKVWWGLWSLVPFVGIVVCVLLGKNGNRSAWEHFAGTASEFDKQQKSLSILGWIWFAAVIIYLIFSKII